MADNPNAFKHWINGDLLKRMAASLQKAWAPFPAEKLRAIEKRLQPLELKARVRLVRENLRALLPDDYEKAVAILLRSAKDDSLKGFDLWPYTDYIEAYGPLAIEKGQTSPQAHPALSLSLRALYQLTQKFTGEFAVRPFLQKYPAEVLKQLRDWTEDPNVHVRRWVSEGSRPRLPWGLRLRILVEKPTLTLPLLEKLKYDDELYVRKSVANHLNDISKDHPKLVVKTLKKWRQEAPKKHQEKILWITRRALRGLLKAGHADALELLGYDCDHGLKITQLKVQKTARVGESVEFTFTLHGDGETQKAMVDYLVHHCKANGKTSPKVFKLKTVQLRKNEKMTITKKHSLKKVTTRKYYPGKHVIEIQVNGKKCARGEFYLRA